MTTWGELRTEIRDELSDDGNNPRWADSYIYSALKDALRDYSHWFPVRQDKVELSGDGEGPYALPADFIDVLFVEVPKDHYLEERRARPGVRFTDRSGKPFAYYLQGGNLYLDTAPNTGDGVFLTYKAVHPIPSAADDDAFELTVPTLDEELIKLYVTAKCVGKARTRQALLDRFKNRSQAGGDRQDNPLLPEADEIWDQYYGKIASRYDAGSVFLGRQGRHK